MNWDVSSRGAVAGLVMNAADFVQHGVLLAGTYKKYTDAFSQTPVSPLYFLAISLCVGIFTAILFGKTRRAGRRAGRGA